MKVLLIDNHPAMLLGLKILLGATEGIEVVGETSRAGEGLRLAERLRPDLVILDLQMRGDLDGVEACRQLKRFEVPPRVLVYTGYESREALAYAVLAGADSYLQKEVSNTKLAEAVKGTCAGERVLVADVEPEEEPHLEKKLKGANLTPKELEVFALVLRRYTNAEIAQELFICVPTVKSHLTNIMRKLSVKNRRDLLRSPLAS